MIVSQCIYPCPQGSLLLKMCLNAFSLVLKKKTHTQAKPKEPQHHSLHAVVNLYAMSKGRTRSLKVTPLALHLLCGKKSSYLIIYNSQDKLQSDSKAHIKSLWIFSIKLLTDILLVN